MENPSLEIRGCRVETYHQVVVHVDDVQPPVAGHRRHANADRGRFRRRADQLMSTVSQNSSRDFEQL